jgi:hypothetical protein
MRYAAPSSWIDSYPLCLDFLNMCDSLCGDRATRISDSKTILDWMESSNVVASHAADEIRARIQPCEMDALSLEALKLATWFKRFIEAFKGHQLPPIAAEQLAPLNRLLAMDVQVTQIEVRDGVEDRIAGSGLKSSTMRIWRSPSMLLLPIADDIVRLLCEQDFRRVCTCEFADCGTYFINTIAVDSVIERDPHFCRVHALAQLSARQSCK